MKEMPMMKILHIVRSTTLPFTYQSGGLHIEDDSTLITYLQAQRLPADIITQARHSLTAQGNVTITMFDEGCINL
jgi:hypothetical protein